jgi:hypothetical protein
MKPCKLIATARVMVVMAVTILIITACAVACAAQTGATTQQRTPARQTTAAQSRAQTRAGEEARGEADENFDLNIVERRITEPDFFASTEVSAGDEAARGLSLRVGVAVGAERIDVLLRNVRGHVRFRASLDALRRVLDARRTTTANETPPVVVP